MNSVVKNSCRNKKIIDKRKVCYYSALHFAAGNAKLLDTMKVNYLGMRKECEE